MMRYVRISTFSRSAEARAFESGRTWKPMMMAFEAFASSTSPSVIAPTPRCTTSTFTSGGERFGGTALVGLDDNAERRGAAFGPLGHEVLERLHATGATVLRLALEALALLRDVARRRGVGHHRERVPRL